MNKTKILEMLETITQLADNNIPPTDKGLSNLELAEAEQIIASTWQFINELSAYAEENV